MWSTFDEKWKDPILQLISGTYFTKKVISATWKMEKKDFIPKKIILATQTLSTMVTPMVVQNLDMLL
jgi:hypothetical protein